MPSVPGGHFSLQSSFHLQTLLLISSEVFYHDYIAVLQFPFCKSHYYRRPCATDFAQSDPNGSRGGSREKGMTLLNELGVALGTKSGQPRESWEDKRKQTWLTRADRHVSGYNAGFPLVSTVLRLSVVVANRKNS